MCEEEKGEPGDGAGEMSKGQRWTKTESGKPCRRRVSE